MKLRSARYFAVFAIVAICALLPQIPSIAIATGDTAKPVSFVRDVAPILIAKCQACHGPKKAESNYRLDSFNALMQPGDFGSPPITASDLESSELHRLITAEDPEERMPNNGARLTDAEIQMISNWIMQGAAFDGKDPAASLRSQVPTDVPHPSAPQAYPNPLPITAMAFTADGSQLVVGGYHELLVWDVKSGALVSRVGNIPQRTFGIAFSPDYSWLAIAGGSPGVSGEVRLVPWSEAAKQQPPKVLASHDDVFFAVAYRPDGSQLVAGGADGMVRLFDVATGTEKLKIASHADWVTALAFSPDGNRIATASRDKTAKVFDASTGTLLATFSEHGAPVRAITFAPDSKSVISAGGGRVCVWNADDAKLIGDMAGFSGELHALLSSGESVVGSSADRSARQFKIADRSLVSAFGEHPAPVVSLAWHPSLKLLGTGCYDGTVTIFNLETGEKVRQYISVPVSAPGGGATGS
jgi:WD40 repeat protein